MRNAASPSARHIQLNASATCRAHFPGMGLAKMKPCLANMAVGRTHLSRLPPSTVSVSGTCTPGFSAGKSWKGPHGRPSAQWRSTLCSTGAPLRFLYRTAVGRLWRLTERTPPLM